MADSDFAAAVKTTLGFEGGYADNPSDPGGETNFGISKRSYPDLDIANLTAEDATAIYYRDFWVPLRCSEMPPAVGMKFFDLAVNMGPRQATKLLQRACVHAGAPKALVIDGRIGDRTVAATTVPMPSALLWALRTEAGNYYREIASEHPALRKFLNGWLRRASA